MVTARTDPLLEGFAMKPTRALAFWLAILAVLGGPAGAQLGQLKKVVGAAKDVAGFQMSDEEEIALGEAISARIRSRYGVAQDPAETRYVSLVGMAVVAESDRPELPWTWVILDSDAVNAFAAPGGFVHITRGALAVMESEAELAGVLAHEAAHVTRKHTLKALEKSKSMDLARSQAPAGGARTKFLVDALADNAADAILAGFGRKEELDADEVGIALAASAGYDPKGLLEFLTTLAARSSGGGGGLFRSHPETEERTERARKQIATDGLEGGARVAERYGASIPYEVAAASTGGPAVEGARGVAGSSGQAAPAAKDDPGKEGEKAEEADDTETEEGGKKGRFKLAKLSNPFQKGSKQESAEVTGAGAGRAVGEEDQTTEGGAKNAALVEVSITPADVAAFKREGGLPG